MIAESSTAGRNEQARAKINLALHVTGRRPDGYHLLDSLVVFPDIADSLSITAAPELELVIDGPFAAALRGDEEDNLVSRAVQNFANLTGTEPNAQLKLTKNLPIASGIGGGSANAAAAIRLMEGFSGKTLSRKQREALALFLGADVPVCLQQHTARMSGIGEIIQPAPTMPEAGIVLVNPRVGVDTPLVFKAMINRENPPLAEMPEAIDRLSSLIAYLRTTRNDMQPAAEALCPPITEVMATFAAQENCLFARMSGSGATCFGLCEPGQEQDLALNISTSHPDWWVAAGRL